MQSAPKTEALFPAVTQSDLIDRAGSDAQSKCLEVGRALRKSRGSPRLMHELLRACRQLAEVTDGRATPENPK